METEAAFKVERFMRREFGLSPTEANADLCGTVLRVTLENAVSPMGRIIAKVQGGESVGGEAVLANVYDTLLDVNRDRMHAMVSRILGVPVRQSRVEADLPTWDVIVTFGLANAPT